jgi:DNA polymerase-3 subunit delta'
MCTKCWADGTGVSFGRRYSIVPIVPIYGHDALRSRLAHALDQGTLPASVLLHGPSGVGKQRLALWLAQVLLCQSDVGRPCGVCQSCRYAAGLTHPDLYWVFPRPRLGEGVDPTEVRQDYADAIADRVRSGMLYGPASGAEGIFLPTASWLVQAAVRTPALARRKVIVVGHAERMVPQEGADAAANAFLKLLEEPPADTTVILTSSEPGALLPTVRSRVTAVRVGRISDADVRTFVGDPIVRAALNARHAPPSNAERVRLAQGAPGSLFDDRASPDTLKTAQALLAGAESAGADRYRTALVQGAAGARGALADALEALTVLLHARAVDAAQRGNAREALAATAAITATEQAKARAGGNISPQLIAVSLMRDVARSAGAVRDHDL